MNSVDIPVRHFYSAIHKLLQVTYEMQPQVTLTRCPWVGENKPHYALYHDEEWGIPVHDDRRFFEMLILEGAQAGLNWETILKRREGYRAAFRQFDPQAVAQMRDEELELQLLNPAIIRNRLKVFSVRQNARVFLAIVQEFGSFDRYVWGFVGGKPIINHPEQLSQVPTNTPQSDALSRDLKRRGMNFVGSTIMYAFMQATGLVNDHLAGCFCARKNS